MKIVSKALLILPFLICGDWLIQPPEAVAQGRGRGANASQALRSRGFPKTISGQSAFAGQSGRGTVSRHQQRYYSARNLGPIRRGGFVYPSSFYRSYSFDRLAGVNYYSTTGRFGPFVYPRTFIGSYPYRYPYHYYGWPTVIRTYPVFYATYGSWLDLNFCAAPIRLGIPHFWFTNTTSWNNFSAPFPRERISLTDHTADRLQALLARQAALKPAIPDSGHIPGLSIARQTSVPVDNMAMADQLLAEAAFREKAYPRALESVQRALQRDRDNGRLWLFSSQVHLALNKYLEAIQDIEAASRLLPEEDWFWVVEHFREFYRDDDYVQQMERLSQHLESRPQDAAAWALRGYHYAGLGHSNAAVLDIDKALARDPENLLYHLLRDRFKPGDGDPPHRVESLPPPQPDRDSVLDPPLKLEGPDKSP